MAREPIDPRRDFFRSMPLVLRATVVVWVCLAVQAVVTPMAIVGSLVPIVVALHVATFGRRRAMYMAALGFTTLLIVMAVVGDLWIHHRESDERAARAHLSNRLALAVNESAIERLEQRNADIRARNARAAQPATRPAE